jgi:hypothetical protein
MPRPYAVGQPVSSVPGDMTIAKLAPGARKDDIWRVPTFKVPELLRRTEVLNRRVKKTGGPGLSLLIEREETRTVRAKDGLGVDAIERWSFLRISGEVPRIDGWDFVARVEHHEGVGNIVSRAPGAESFELPADARTADPTCDHCKAFRRRNDTFVLAKDGMTRRVGRNCLQDFLRGADPEVALRLWSLLASVRSLLDGASEEGFGEGGSRDLDTIGFLACTASAIRHRGWMSKGEAYQRGGVATAVTAAFIAGPAPKGRAREDWDAMRPTDADYEEAGEVVAWASGLEEANDYLQNLRVAVSIGHVGKQHEGIVASGVMAYRRARERALEEARQAAHGAERPSEHIGVVGQRYDFRGLTVTSARPLPDNGFGSSTLVLMEDPSGNEIKTFYRGQPPKVGDVLGGKATVSKHEEFKGRKQTVVIRAKFQTGLPVQGVLPIPTSAQPAETPHFTDEEIPF